MISIDLTSDRWELYDKPGVKAAAVKCNDIANKAIRRALTIFKEEAIPMNKAVGKALGEAFFEFSKVGFGASDSESVYTLSIVVCGAFGLKTDDC